MPQIGSWLQPFFEETIFYCRSEDLSALQGAVCKILEKAGIIVAVHLGASIPGPNSEALTRHTRIVLLLRIWLMVWVASSTSKLGTHLVPAPKWSKRYF